MASSTNRSIIILGSGPGIGVGVASHFAAETFNRVALLSRDASRLDQDAASVREASHAKGRKNVDIRTYPVDLADTKALEHVLKVVVKDLGPPEVVVYNAARVGGGKYFDADEESVIQDFRVCKPKT
jgi:NAD(P)-dependent dehydrogenase (short-subunit alcohol dehydrogenase family)